MLLSIVAAAATSHHLPLLSNPSSTKLQQQQLHRSKLSCSLSPLDCAAASETNGDGGGGVSTPSAAAVAEAIMRASPASPVEFEQRVEKAAVAGHSGPSPDFQRLCSAQIDLFRMTVHRDAVLSVYVRPAGSYVMDQLELRRATYYPGVDMADNADCVILVANFSVPAGLRAAEASLLKRQVDVIAEFGALVLPMVKHPFVVGFLVAEIPDLEIQASRSRRDEQGEISSYADSQGASPFSNESMRRLQALEEDMDSYYAQFTADQRARAIMISCSLAAAYVMDQKAILLQQSSWHNNVRMSHLVEQMRGPLSSIRALSKMLSTNVKKSEIAHDIIEDILVQGGHMRDALQQLQDAVYLTKVNIVRYNEGTLNKLHGGSSIAQQRMPEVTDSCSSETQMHSVEANDLFLLPGLEKDIEMPMPPLLLAPLQQNTVRPCAVSDLLTELVGAAIPLAKQQQKTLKLRLLSEQLQVAVEESALRQALSNLIEGALLRTTLDGRVDIYATSAPAGGVLIVVDDNGPDMHYMTQMHSLMPFGLELFSDGTAEDNMTWNFVAGLTVAREILESFGCIIRVLSPRISNAALGAGGTRVELWLPAPQSDPVGPVREA